MWGQPPGNPHLSKESVGLWALSLMPVYFMIASMAWFLLLLSNLFMIFNKSKICLICSPSEAVLLAFHFLRCGFHLGQPYKRIRVIGGSWASLISPKLPTVFTSHKCTDSYAESIHTVTITS